MNPDQPNITCTVCGIAVVSRLGQPEGPGCAWCAAILVEDA